MRIVFDLRLLVVALLLAPCGCSRRSFREPSASMEPTIHLGQHFQTTNLTGPPARGQAVVVKSPGEGHPLYAKRVIATGGDTIEIRVDHLFLDGAPVPRCVVGHYPSTRPELAGEMVVEYLAAGPYLTLYTDQSMASARATPLGPAFTVPAGQVFVLGDNRLESLHSRNLAGAPGGLPVSEIVSSVTPPNGAEPTLPADAPPELVAALAACLRSPPLEDRDRE